MARSVWCKSLRYRLGGGDIDTKIGKVGAVFEQAFDDTIFIGIVCANVKDDLHGRPLLINSPSASFLAQAYV